MLPVASLQCSMSLEADVPVQVLEVESLAWIDKLPVPYQAVGAGCVLSGLSSSFGSTFLSVFFTMNTEW